MASGGIDAPVSSYWKHNFCSDLSDTVGRLLESNRSVRCVIIDFSKAFDTVNHEILLKKNYNSSQSLPIY